MFVSDVSDFYFVGKVEPYFLSGGEVAFGKERKIFRETAIGIFTTNTYYWLVKVHGSKLFLLLRDGYMYFLV